MTETTIWDIEEHRREPVGIRNFSFRESFDHLADYLDGYNIREPRTFDPENGGNPLMVRFSGGVYVGGSLNMLRDDPGTIRTLHCSAARYRTSGTRTGTSSSPATGTAGP